MRRVVIFALFLIFLHSACEADIYFHVFGDLLPNTVMSNPPSNSKNHIYHRVGLYCFNREIGQDSGSVRLGLGLSYEMNTFWHQGSYEYLGYRLLMWTAYVVPEFRLFRMGDRFSGSLMAAIGIDRTSGKDLSGLSQSYFDLPCYGATLHPAARLSWLLYEDELIFDRLEIFAMAGFRTRIAGSSPLDALGPVFSLGLGSRVKSKPHRTNRS